MLIRNGRDYYDGAGMGVDPRVVYARAEILIENPPFRLPGAIGEEARRWRDRPADSPEIRFHLAVIGAAVFPGLRVKTCDGQIRWMWDRKEARDFAVETAKLGVATYLRPKKIDAIKRHFDRERDPHAEWRIRHGVITGVAVRADRGHDPDRRVLKPDTVLVANAPNLKDHEVFRACDPATAHMEIENWIRDRLAPSPVMVELGDRSRILKAGFDLKTSFRHPVRAR